MTDAARSALPSNEELEVSVFGLRKGESIVVHVPDGPWFVIDSMAAGTGDDRAPVAATYLRDYMGVRDLYGVFLTHWHDDHTAGAARLIEAFAASLQIAGLPIAFSTRELMAFVNDLLPDAQRAALQKDTLEIMSMLKRPALSAVRSVTLQDGVSLQPAGANWKLEALSPSLEDVRAQAATLAKFLPGYEGPPVSSFDVNSACAVLRLETHGIVALFSSDLDVGDSASRGWQGVHRSHGARLAAKIVKVGHHGSDTAIHPPSWIAMASGGKPHGVITPFPARNGALPRNKEIAGFKQRCERLHLAGVRRSSEKTAGLVSLKHTPFRNYADTSPPSAFEKGAAPFRRREMLMS